MNHPKLKTGDLVVLIVADSQQRAEWHAKQLQIDAWQALWPEKTPSEVKPFTGILFDRTAHHRRYPRDLVRAAKFMCQTPKHLGRYTVLWKIGQLEHGLRMPENKRASWG